MITLNELRNAIARLIKNPKDYKYEQVIYDFLNQQEKKDKLLGLYRMKDSMNIFNTPYDVWKIIADEIKTIEEELK